MSVVTKACGKWVVFICVVANCCISFADYEDRGDKKTTTDATKAFIERIKKDQKSTRPMSAFESDESDSFDRVQPSTGSLADLLTSRGLFVNGSTPLSGLGSFSFRGAASYMGLGASLLVDDFPSGCSSADFNWIIPELVKKVAIRSWHGLLFSTDSSFLNIRLTTNDELSRDFARITLGTDKSFRVLAASSIVRSNWQGLTALEYMTLNPYYLSSIQDKKYNLFTKVSHTFSPKSRIAIIVSAYQLREDNKWDDPIDHLLMKASSVKTDFDHVYSINESKVAPDFKARYSLGGYFERQLSEVSNIKVSTIAVHSQSDLAKEAVVNTDSGSSTLHEKQLFFGSSAKYQSVQWNKDTGTDLQIGLDIRTNHINIKDALEHNYLTTVSAGPDNEEVGTYGAGLYVREVFGWTYWLKTGAGIRVDWSKGDGSLSRLYSTTVSSNAALALLLSSNTSLIGNVGSDYNAQDLRSIAMSHLSYRVTGYEIGFRTLFFKEALKLKGIYFNSSEDESSIYHLGTSYTVPSNTHNGIQLSAQYQLIPWLTADGDFTLSSSKSNLGSTITLPVFISIPFSLSESIGLTAKHKSGFFSKLTLVHVVLDQTYQNGYLLATHSSRLDIGVGYKGKYFDIQVKMFNCFNEKWYYGQYLAVSKEGRSSFFSTPGYPLTVQTSATVYF